MRIKLCLLKFLFILVFPFITPVVTLASPYSKIYVIGDSLSDQGNLFQATSSLIGSGRPADDHYFMGRFSNGEVYAGLLAERLGVFLTATSLDGTNYAYGGTRTHYNIVEDPPTSGGFVPGLFPWTLNLQRQAFIDHAINDPHALYIVFSGSNDVGDLIGRTIIQGFDATKPMSDQAVQGIRNVIQAFIAAGARDILVPNLPDLGLVPRVFNRDPLPGLPPDSTLVADTATNLTVRFNNALNEMLDEFNHVNIIRFDTFSFLKEITINPAAYGLTNSIEPCYTGFVDPADPADTVCDSPASFIFWDNEHPTTAFHALLADKMLATMLSDLLDDLIQQVTGLALPKGVGDSLHAKLTIAKRIHEDTSENNDVAAIVALQAFVNQINAQRGYKLSEETADALIELARKIKQIIERMVAA